MGPTVDASVAGTAAFVINAPRERWLLSMVCSSLGWGRWCAAQAASRSASPWVSSELGSRATRALRVGTGRLQRQSVGVPGGVAAGDDAPDDVAAGRPPSPE